jgi:hypothetical protein
VWVGIDGYNDGTVEQIGTSENVVNGVPVYQVWWEMYSSGDQQPQQIISGMAIQPGDSITASVQYVTSGTYAGDFKLSITDTSRSNDSFTTYESSAQTQSPGADRSSAEWVVEAPTVGNNVAALANFGSVTFTSASATINGVSGPINDSAWQSQAINMATGNGTLEDTTSVLTASGTSFVVTDDSSAGAANSGSGGSGRNSRNLAPEATLTPTASVVAISASVTTPPQVVVYGVTPVPQSNNKPSAFAVPGRPLGS